VPKDFSNILFEKEGAMSIKVGRLIGILQKTACMNSDERTVIGYLEFLKILFKSDKNFIEFIDKVILPFIEFQGHARWKRDVVTDLGLAMSRKRERVEKTDKILLYVPEKAKQ